MFKIKLVEKPHEYPFVIGFISDLVTGDIIVPQSGGLYYIERVERFPEMKDEFVYARALFESNSNQALRQVPRGTRYKKLLASIQA